MYRSKLVSALLFFLGLFIATTSFASDKVVITSKAREHFKAGVAYVDDPNGPKYEEAYREFRIAHADSPTYRILTNIGLCALNLERDSEAIEAYEEYLAHATAEDIPKNKRAIMERDVATMKASLVRVTVTTPVTNISLADERVPSKGNVVINRYEVKDGKVALGIHPGHHRITATAEGYDSQTWEFDADSATTHAHAFELSRSNSAAPVKPAVPAAVKSVAEPSQPAEPSEKKTPTFVYGGLAATGIFAITATITGLMANTKKSDYDALNKTGQDPARAADLHDSVQRLELMTDIGIGAAVLAAAGTAIVYFTASSGKPDAKTKAKNWQLSPTVGASHAGVNFAGQF